MLRAAPTLLSALAAAAPARVVKKLDADREVARSWTWMVGPDGGTVAIAGGETVTVRASDGLVTEPTAFTCSCLLTPRCFHVLGGRGGARGLARRRAGAGRGRARPQRRRPRSPWTPRGARWRSARAP
ncbi:MAG: hypothetical protein U0270_20480 [Labilithrix sp.]